MNIATIRFARIHLLLFAGLLLLTLSKVAAEAKPTFITIGSGGHRGNYYSVGRAICDQVNQSRDRHAIRCSVESTSGSVYNLNAMRSGEIEMGLSQSDRLDDAYRGDAPFTEQGPFKALRTLFSLYPEPFTVVARKEAGILQLSDLKHKRVYIGQPDSGQHATMLALMQELDWDRDDIDEPEQLTTARPLQALCEDEVDAMVLTVGHPYQPIVKAASTCELVVVEVAGPAVDQLVTTHPYYEYAGIKGTLYAGNPAAIRSFGATATFVGTSAIDEETVYHVVKAVFEQFDAFKHAHPRLGSLVRERMINEDLAVPLHEGAIRYYREAGLIEASPAVDFGG